MRSISPLVVAALVALPGSVPARAQHAVVHTAPAHNAGTNNAMAQQQKAMEAQLKQQQRAMEAQLKQEQQQMMKQQQAMQKQAAAQQKAMQQAATHQQHAMQQAAAHEQKAALQQMKAAIGLSNAGTAASTTNAAHQTAASKTAHHTTHVTVHHPITYWRTWPISTHSHYTHLESLKRHLDSVAMKSVPTTTQKIGLKNALVNVIENSPHPASSHMQIFANHLADSIASRTTPLIDTRDMALQLRVMVNNVHMTPADLDAALTQHQALMLGAGVPASHVGVLSDDLRYLVGETQTKAMR